MPKQVLNVGQCGFDHGNISRLISSNFDAAVEPADSLEEALRMLRAGSFDLVLVNRLLDLDHSEGILLLESIKSDEELSTIPVMLVTNFAEHQQRAVEAGAELGFGKAELHEPETLEKLAALLRAS